MNLFDQLNSLDDLRGLIDREERESDFIEYKTAATRLKPSDRAEVAKDASAFANASGGLLVFGIRTDAEDKTLPVALEPIEPWNVDYIIQSLPAAIRHPLEGVRTKTLPAGATPQALLVDIPASSMSPHQVVSSYRYYRRQGAESAPMSHDLIELYFGRRTAAQLEPDTRCSPFGLTPDGSREETMLTIALYNAGGRIGRDVMTRFEIATGVSATAQQFFVGNRVLESEGSNAIPIILHVGELYHPRMAKPVVRLKVSAPPTMLGRDNPVLYLDVFADEMRPRRFRLYFSMTESGRLEKTLRFAEDGLPPIRRASE